VIPSETKDVSGLKLEILGINIRTLVRPLNDTQDMGKMNPKNTLLKLDTWGRFEEQK